MPICSPVRPIQTISQKLRWVNSCWGVNGKSQRAAGASNRLTDFDGNPRVGLPATSRLNSEIALEAYSNRADTHWHTTDKLRPPDRRKPLNKRNFRTHQYGPERTQANS